jgi:hypothetical protein
MAELPRLAGRANAFAAGKGEDGADNGGRLGKVFKGELHGCLISAPMSL